MALSEETYEKIREGIRRKIAERALNPRSKWCPQIPTEKQKLFLSLNDNREVFYGGAAGGAKSSALLMAALEFVDVKDYAAIIFRRTYTDLALPDALMDRARRWLSQTPAKWIDKDKTWRFPSGATLTFAYMENEADKYRYQGSAYQFCAFDELTQFTETQYLYLFSRLRRLEGADIPIRMRSGSNPGGIGARWVHKRFVPEQFSPHDAEGTQVFWKEGVDLEGRPTRRAFIPARLMDNPYLDRREYEDSLNELDPVTREQLLKGDWRIVDRGDIYPMWDEKYHVIPWSAFNAVYRSNGIPEHWQCAVFMDVGTTEGHPNVTSWFATAPENAPLSGSVFLYRGQCVYDQTVRQIAEHINSVGRTEKNRTNVWRMSHEGNSERIAYNREFGIPFAAWKADRNRGIAQVRNYLEIQHRNSEHPFNEVMGRPSLYLVVDDEQVDYPRDDRGLARWREEFPAYHYKIPKSGEVAVEVVPHPTFNDAMDTCLIAGTLITTKRGDIPIEEVHSRDLILTRNGYQSTTGSWQTSPLTTVYKVQWTQNTLIGTASHPIWVEGKGFVPLAQLQIGDSLCPRESIRTSRARVKSLSLRECVSIVTQAARAMLPVITFSLITISDYEASAHFTSRFGRMLTGQFQKAMKSITKITTALTTPLIIWSASPLTITPNGTRANLPATGSERIWPQSMRKQRRGIEAKPDDYGIVRMPKPHGASAVYNLSVCNHPEYFANGILVHNCRAAGAEYFAPIVPLSRDERVERQIEKIYKGRTYEDILNLPPTERDGAIHAYNDRRAELMKQDKSSVVVHSVARWKKRKSGTW